MPIPSYSLDITGLTDEFVDPTSAVQFCIVDRDGERRVYGDQSWVADGRALAHHEGGHIESRTITITYGEWSSIPSESRSNP